MSDKEFKGIFVIPCTPFKKTEGVFIDVDEDSLRSLVNYIVEAGAHGITVPQLASEFYTLSEDERKRMTEIVIETVKGRVPVVIGVQAVNTRLAVTYAKHAYEKGADAVIALPPYLPTGGEERIFNYFKAISDAIDIPVFIQNGGPPLGSSLTPVFIAKIVKKIENVKYVKEEVMPTTHSISADLKACGDAIKGVFGGAGGRYMIEEFKRGAVGNMPTCEYTEIAVEVYNRYAKGDEEGARELHKELTALQNINHIHGAVKEVLRRRGIIRATHSRIPTPSLDEFDCMEIERNVRKAMQISMRCLGR